jgi:hypothetical protein
MIMQSDNAMTHMKALNEKKLTVRTVSRAAHFRDCVDRKAKAGESTLHRIQRRARRDATDQTATRHGRH